MSTGRVGAPLTVNDFMLVSWKEGSYSITDKPYPRGEIIVGELFSRMFCCKNNNRNQFHLKVETIYRPDITRIQKKRKKSSFIKTTNGGSKLAILQNCKMTAP